MKTDTIKAIALGAELNGLALVGYLFHDELAAYFDLDQNLTLAFLMLTILVLWTVRAIISYK